MAELPRLTTKQQLYDRIRAASKDEVIVEEMIRLGFWEAESGGLPVDPRNDNERIALLEERLRTVAQQGMRLRDPAEVKAELRRRRMAEVRTKRAERKREREVARIRRAAAWAERKRVELLYLGPGVSTTLGRREGAVRPGLALPELHDAKAIADAMAITVSGLRFLAFERRVSPITHWRRFQVPKKTGGLRTISAPMPRLKAAQRWILENVLEKVPVHDAAHGFVRGRSIVSNAAAHVGKSVVVNFDLRDFFPTLTWVRVRGVFRSLGYSGEAATIFALLCTESEVDEVELDGKRWFVKRGPRHLPQGSPCSPAITNVVCMRLDQRLSGLARSLGFVYTRYADDLTFSGEPERLKSLMGAVRAIVEAEGFAVHPDKTRIMRKGGRQEVTGLVVNRKLGVSRSLLRKWRAALFQLERDGRQAVSFGTSGDPVAALVGFAAFVYMVDPTKGAALLTRARAAAAAAGPRPSAEAEVPPEVPEAPPPVPAEAPAPATPDAAWWQFWRWFRG